MERFTRLLASTAEKILLLSLIKLKRDCFAVPYFLTAAPHHTMSSLVRFLLRILYFSTILLQFNFRLSPPIRQFFTSREINLYVYQNIPIFSEIQTFECDFEKKLNYKRSILQTIYKSPMRAFLLRGHKKWFLFQPHVSSTALSIRENIWTSTIREIRKIFRNGPSAKLNPRESIKISRME